VNDILRDLARAKVAFQLRAIEAVIRDDAIAIEARQRTDPEEGLDPKGKSAGPKDIAQ
jgi:hypothetical protein